MDMSKMTAEQRARIEAMMANMQKHPHTAKTCLTEEKLEKNPFDNKTDRCTQTIVSSTSSEYDARFQCKDEDGGTSSGEYHFIATSPELVTGNVHVTINRAGHTMESSSKIIAKYVGASCGEVK